MGDAAQNSHQRSAEDPNQDSAIDLARHEDQSQGEAEAGRLYFLVGETAQADEGRRDSRPRVWHYADRQRQ